MSSPTYIYKSVWISDIHLGNKDCHAEYLLHFLNSIRCETLYLVGDIVDLMAMRRRSHWQSSHKAVLKKLLDLSCNGTRVIYIPGNHDIELRELCELPFFNFELMQTAVHTTAAGRRLLVTHGDEFEHAILASTLNRVVGEKAHHFLVFANRWLTKSRKRLGLPYWSLATYIKDHLSQARNTILKYEETAATTAKAMGYDGVICGHIHKAEKRFIDGILYCNDGDWTESCTALTESKDGQLELFEWTEAQDQLYSHGQTASAA